MTGHLAGWAVGTMFGLAMAGCVTSAVAPPPPAAVGPAPTAYQRPPACRAIDAHGNCGTWLRRE